MKINNYLLRNTCNKWSCMYNYKFVENCIQAAIWYYELNISKRYNIFWIIIICNCTNNAHLESWWWANMAIEGKIWGKIVEPDHWQATLSGADPGSQESQCLSSKIFSLLCSIGTQEALHIVFLACFKIQHVQYLKYTFEIATSCTLLYPILTL